MRVIGGIAKGRRLQRVPGDTTRPIMDRVKESLFNILGDVQGERWLDLFAGTGQVGIEALSRGASEVIFADKVRPAVRTIQANLRLTGLAAAALVRQTDAFVYLQHPPERPFDVIYVAPPQYQDLWLNVVRLLDGNPTAYLTATGIVIVQIDPREYQSPGTSTLTIYDDRRYGNTQLLFFNCRPSG